MALPYFSIIFMKYIQTRILAVALLIIAGTLVYYQGINGSFIFDDYSNLSKTRLSHLNWEQLLATSLRNDSGALKRPVSNLSFALNFYYFGESPVSYKAINISIHILIGILLFFLTQRLLVSTPFQKASYRILFSIGVSAVWLLHPLQVSTVLYIVQRMAQLSALFTVLSILLYVIGRQYVNKGNTYGFPLIITSLVLCFPLALFSKENGALVPFFILAVEWIIFRFDGLPAKTRYVLLSLLSVFCVLPIATGLVYILFHFTDILNMYSSRPFSMSERLLTESLVLVKYIKMMLLPYLSEMALYHDDIHIQTILDIKTTLAITVLGASLACVPWLRKRHPIAALGVIWFFISHSMESTILPLELMFEHRNYLALFGPMLVAAYGLYVILSHTRKSHIKRALVIFPVFIIIGYTLLTVIRVGSWSNRQVLIHTMERNHPTSPRLQIELANYDINNKDYTSAYQRIDRIIKFSPWDPGPYFMRIVVKCAANEYDPRDFNSAISHLRSASIYGTLPSTLRVLVKMRTDKNKCTNIPLNAIMELINETLNHPRISQYTNILQLLYGLEYKIYKAQGNIESALISLDNAFNSNTREMGPLLEKAYIELNNNMPTNAKMTLEKIEHHNKWCLCYNKHYIRELKNNIALAVRQSK